MSFKAVIMTALMAVFAFTGTAKAEAVVGEMAPEFTATTPMALSIL